MSAKSAFKVPTHSLGARVSTYRVNPRKSATRTADGRTSDQSPSGFARNFGADSDLRQYGLCLAREETSKSEEGPSSLSHESSPYLLLMLWKSRDLIDPSTL